MAKVIVIKVPGPQGPKGEQGAPADLNTLGLVFTSSFNAYTSSVNSFTASYNTGSFTGSFIGLLSGTSSFALTASYVPNASSFPFTGSAVITGSLVVTGSIRATTGFTGSLLGTASWAQYANAAFSAVTAQNANLATTASRAETAEFADSAGSASYSLISITADTASNVFISPQTAPYNTVNRPLLYPAPTASIQLDPRGSSVELIETSIFYNENRNQTTFLPNAARSTASVIIGDSSQPGSGRLIVYGEVWHSSLNVLPNTIKFVDSLDTGSAQTLTSLSYIGNRLILSSGSYSGSFSGSLFGTASWAISSSQAITASYAATASITYVSSSNLSLSEIEVADYSNDVAVTFVNGRLKFIFGTPLSQSITSFTLSDFATDRFNRVLDGYTASAVWANNGYTLISASIFTGSVLLAQTGTGTSLSYPMTTSGSQVYMLHVTASSPLDNTIVAVTRSVSGTLSKSNPGNPTLTATATVQLGATSNQIEQGATGSITFTSSSGAANSWVLSSITTNYTSPLSVTGSLTGSSAISITATSYYSSSGVNGSDNSPALTTTTTTTTTYNKIRSIRYGTIATNLTASVSQSWLENLSNWDTTLGGTIGTVVKGTVDPTTSGYTAPSLTTSGNHFIFVIDNTYTLTSILNTGANLNDLSVFTLSTVGPYKVYYSTNPSSATITYRLIR